MGKQKHSMPAVGASSLLVIFTVLCLTVFAMLSLSTATADGRISDASAKAVTDYYAADAQAEIIFARLRAGEAVTGTDITCTIADYPDRSESVYSYAVPVDEGQELQVELCRSGGSWSVARWQLASIGQWEPDDTLTVWDGE